MTILGWQVKLQLNRADFIKTSTGKIKPAATLPITLVMLEVIKDHYYNTGKMVGMKPAGGISNSKLPFNT